VNTDDSSDSEDLVNFAQEIEKKLSQEVSKKKSIEVTKKTP
jgi:hypothetical protein